MMWTLFILMLLAALVLLLYPMLRASRRAIVIDSNSSNVSILKDQLAELQDELDAGNLDQETYLQARTDLETSAAMELSETDEPNGVFLQRKHGVLLSVLVGGFIGLGSLLFYQSVTTYQELKTTPQQSVASGEAEQLPPLNEMAEVLAARLRQNPEDARGWQMLGKTYMMLDRLEDAVGAFDKSYQLAGDGDPELLADYAEALAYAGGETMLGKPSELINTALKLDPMHPKSLWLAGFAAMQNGANNAAIQHWETLVGIPGLEPETRQLALEFIARAWQLQGESGETVAARPATPRGLVVKVNVTLDESLKSQVQPDEIIYVFAKASEGMPMPVAVKRISVADLPVTVELDDSMAMLKGNNLSSQAKIIVGARVSRDGAPMAQPGDLQGLGEVIDPRQADLQNIVINQVVQ